MATTQPLQNIVDWDERATWKDPVSAAQSIFRGQMVALDASLDAEDPTDVAGRECVGVAVETVENLAAFGGGAAGDKFVNIARRARAIFNSTGTLAVGDQCFVVDNDTVTDAATAVNDIPVGRIFATTGFEARHGMTGAVLVDIDVSR